MFNKAKNKIFIAGIALLQLLGTYFTLALIFRRIGLGQSSDLYLLTLAIQLFLTAITSSLVQINWQIKLRSSLKLNKFFHKSSLALTQTLIISSLISIIGVIVGITIDCFAVDYSDKYPHIIRDICLIFSINNIVQSLLFSHALIMRVLNRLILAEFLILNTVLFSGLGIYLYKGSAITVIAGIVTFSNIVTLLLFHFCNQEVRFLSFKKLIPYLFRKSNLITIFSSMVYKSVPSVDRIILSYGQVGNISIFSLASSALTATVTVLEKTISHSISMKFIDNLNKNNPNTFHEINKKIKAFFVLSIIIIILLYTCRFFFSNLLTFIFNIDDANSLKIVFLIAGFFVALVPYALGGTIVNFHYHTNDFITPARIGVIGNILSIPLKIIFFYFFGMYGLVLITIIAAWILFSINYFLVRKINDQKNN